MIRTFKTIVVPAQHAAMIGALAAVFGPGTLSFGSTLPCGAGGDPETHYITSGMLGEDFVLSLASAAALRDGLSSVMVLDDEAAGEIWASLDISDEAGETALARLGLEVPLASVET